MDFKAAIEAAGQWVDLAGVAAVVIGALVSIPLALRRRGDDGTTLYRSYRQLLGRSILLGLELLVAADIIRTVAVTPTLQSVAVLAVIVVIRTFLSFFPGAGNHGPLAVAEGAASCPAGLSAYGLGSLGTGTRGAVRRV